MTPAQSYIATVLRDRLGDELADEVVQGWAADGVDQPRPTRASPAELARLMAWRASSDPRRRQVAIVRLAALGYDVSLKRQGADRVVLDVTWNRDGGDA